MYRTFFKIIISIFIVISSCQNLYSQKSNISFHLGYPFTTGNSFFSFYDGKINTGLSYSYLLSKKFCLKFSLDYGRFNFDIRNSPDVNANLYKIRSCIGYNYHLIKRLKLLTEVGLGYSLLNYSSKLNIQDNNENGINILSGLGLFYNFHKNYELGLSLKYDYTYLEKPEVYSNISYNREINTTVIEIIFAHLF